MVADSEYDGRPCHRATHHRRFMSLPSPILLMIAAACGAAPCLASIVESRGELSFNGAIFAQSGDVRTWSVEFNISTPSTVPYGSHVFAVSDTNISVAGAIGTSSSGQPGSASSSHQTIFQLFQPTAFRMINSVVRFPNGFNNPGTSIGFGCSIAALVGPDTDFRLNTVFVTQHSNGPGTPVVGRQFFNNDFVDNFESEATNRVIAAVDGVLEPGIYRFIAEAGINNGAGGQTWEGAFSSVLVIPAPSGALTLLGSTLLCCRRSRTRLSTRLIRILTKPRASGVSLSSRRSRSGQ